MYYIIFAGRVEYGYGQMLLAEDLTSQVEFYGWDSVHSGPYTSANDVVAVLDTFRPEQHTSPFLWPDIQF